MSMTSDQAQTALRTRIDGAGVVPPMYWEGDVVPPLPDTPSPFVYFVFDNEGSGRGPAAYGGGLRQNLYRNQALLMGFVFVPRGAGSGIAAQQVAETVAASVRSMRIADLAVHKADVMPAGPGSSVAPRALRSPVSNYQCAIAVIELHFDQIG
jgi:hypothetical protein